jgi:hypothetical protein
MHHYMHIARQPFNRKVNGFDRRPYFLVIRNGEIWLINLNMFAASVDQASEVMVEQLPEIDDHPFLVVVILIVRHCRQKMWPCHCHLDRPAGEARDSFKLIHQTKIDLIRDGPSANGRWVKHVWIVPGDCLGLGLALERWDLFPKMIQHCIWRRVPVMPPAVQLSSRDYVDPGSLLFEDGGLRRAQLGIRHVALGKVAQRD